MPIGIKILISEVSLYCVCTILIQETVHLKDTQKCSELLEKCGYHHLLHVKFYWGDEKNRSFHRIPKTPFQWLYPKVIGSYTGKGVL